MYSRLFFPFTVSGNRERHRRSLKVTAVSSSHGVGVGEEPRGSCHMAWRMTPAWLVSTIRTAQTVKDIFPQNSLFHISLLVAHWGCDFIMLAYYWFLCWLIHIVSFHLWSNQAELLSLCYRLRKCGTDRLWVVHRMSQLKKIPFSWTFMCLLIS